MDVSEWFPKVAESYPVLCTPPVEATWTCRWNGGGRKGWHNTELQEAAPTETPIYRPRVDLPVACGPTLLPCHTAASPLVHRARVCRLPNKNISSAGPSPFVGLCDRQYPCYDDLSASNRARMAAVASISSAATSSASASGWSCVELCVGCWRERWRVATNVEESKRQLVVAVVKEGRKSSTSSINTSTNTNFRRKRNGRGVQGRCTRIGINPCSILLPAKLYPNHHGSYGPPTPLTLAPFFRVRIPPAPLVNLG